MCVLAALLQVRRDLSSYEPALSESHSSLLCLALVRSLKVAWGPLWWSAVLGAANLEGSMAKMEYDEARSPLGASLVVLRSRGWWWSDSRWINSPPLQSSARRWWESVQLIPSGGSVTSRI